MAFASLSWLTLGVIVFLVVAFIYATSHEDRAQIWTARTVATKDYVRVRWDEFDDINVNQHITVLVEKGKHAVVVATIPIASNSFSDDLIAAQQAAYEKASELNALVAA